MKTVDPRSLLSDELKNVNVSGEVLKTFQQLQSLLKEKLGEDKDLDSLGYFYAGYILANPVIRDEFKKIRQKEIQYDDRIDETLWSKK